MAFGMKSPKREEQKIKGDAMWIIKFCKWFEEKLSIHLTKYVIYYYNGMECLYVVNGTRQDGTRVENEMN